MPAITYQATQFNPIKFNPALSSLAVAKTFKGINDTLNTREAAKSLAASRQQANDLAVRAQDFTEGGTERKIQEADRLRAQSAAQGLAGIKFTDEINNAAKEELFQNQKNVELMQSDPRFQAATGLSADGVGPLLPGNATKLFDLQDDFAENNKNKLLRPTDFKNRLNKRLLESGQFDAAGATAFSTTTTSEQFPTLSIEQQKLLFSANKNATNSDGSPRGSNGRGGSFRSVFNEGGPDSRAENVNRIAELNDLPNRTGLVERLFRVSGLDVTASKAEVGKAFAMLAESGIPSGSAASAAMQQAFNVDGDLRDDMDWNKTEGKANLIAAAKRAQAVETQQRNSRTGQIFTGESSPANLQKQSFARADQILARGTSPRFSDEELVSQFLSSFDAVPEATAPQAAPPTTSTQSGILSPLEPKNVEGVLDGFVSDVSAGVSPEGAVPDSIGPIFGNTPTANSPGAIQGIDINNIPDNSIGTRLLRGVKGNLDTVGNLNNAASSAILNGAKAVGNGLSSVNTVLSDSRKRTQKFSEKLQKEKTDRYAKEVIEKLNSTKSIDGINRFHVIEALASDLLNPSDRAIIQKLLNNS